MVAGSEVMQDPPAIDQMRWYHTLAFPDGRLTPGEYDLRPIADRLPWPAAMTGLRCLDVGSRDGFYSFEMERRGASEVVSVDIDDPSRIDLPQPAADRDVGQAELDAGNLAFEVARAAFASSVERRHISVYELSSESVGRFDFAVIGTLLHHLRDPVGALMAIRQVLDGKLLVNDAVMADLSIARRKPIAHPIMEGGPYWWAVNPPALRRMIEAAGFAIERQSRPYLVPYGSAGRPPSIRSVFRRPFALAPARFALRYGAPHVWLLAG